MKSVQRGYENVRLQPNASKSIPISTVDVGKSILVIDRTNTVLFRFELTQANIKVINTTSNLADLIFSWQVVEFY